MQLVGLVKHPKPAVYLTGGTPKGRGTPVARTRDADPFEQKSLDAIRGGGGLQGERRGGEYRAVGAIYAGAQCLTCHERKGEMLGAFSYRLTLSM